MTGPNLVDRAMSVDQVGEFRQLGPSTIDFLVTGRRHCWYEAGGGDDLIM